MWKWLMTVLLLAALTAPDLVPPGAVAEAKGRKTRTAEATYETDVSDPGATAWFGEHYGVFFGEAVTFATRRRERSVSIEIEDEHGRPLTAAVWQDGGTTTVICAGTDRPLRIQGGVPLLIQVFVDVTPTVDGGCDTPDIPSSGIVSATFRTNR